jgi:TonB family protein
VRFPDYHAARSSRAGDPRPDLDSICQRKMHSFIKVSSYVRLVILALVLDAGVAHAQRAERVGDFSVEVSTSSVTGQDSSFAVLWPGGRYFSREVSAGLLFLACGGDRESMSGAFLLSAFGGAGDTLVLAMRLGQAPPDTVILDGGGEGGTGWLLRDRDVEPVLRRALASDSLFIQMLGGSVPGERMAYTYSLAGLDAVLARLGCTVAPPAPGRMAGRGIVRHLLAGVGSPQSGERVGHFSIEVRADSVTGQNASFAVLRPRGGYLSATIAMGHLFLACGGDSAAMGGAFMLPAFGGAGDTLLVTARLGRAPPDTIVLDGHGDGGASWFLRDGDVKPILRRALASDSLHIEMVGGSAPGEPTAYTYPLAGLDTVLARLGCTAAPAAPGRLTGTGIVQQQLSGAVPEGLVEYPRVTDRAQFARSLARGYPAELRRARERGEVLVRFRVKEDGLVDAASVQVLRSTNEAFNAGAMEAVRQLRFRPAAVYGRPVKVWIELPVVFTPPA